MPPLLLLPALLLFAAADAYPSPPCSNATCGDLTIAYPFWLNSSSASDDDCGYPGFGLKCESSTTLILLAGLHLYRVLSIDYDTHTLALADADVDAVITSSCPLLDFNLTVDTSSGLQLAQTDSNITFLYNCKGKGIASWPSAVELPDCPEENTTSYVFTDDVAVTGEAYEYGCDQVVVAPVLDVHKKAILELANRPGEVLRAGFELIYSPNTELCRRCERSGGWCGYRHNQTNGGKMGFTCFCNGGPTGDHCSKYASLPTAVLVALLLVLDFRLLYLLVC